jgi:hypothetical protein
MKKLIYTFIIIVLLSPISFASDLEITEVLSKQNQYLQKLYSLEFTAKIIGVGSEESTKLQKLPANKLESRMIFVYNGSKYRSEVLAAGPPDEKKPTYVSAYDGERYYLLEVKQKPILFLSRRPHSFNNPYYGINPVLFPFEFVFQKGDELSIKTLQKEEIWSRLKSEIIETQKIKKSGHDGIKIILKKRLDVTTGREEIYEVFFAEDLNYYPIYWKSTDQLIKGWTETSVLEFKRYGEENGNIIIPTRIQSNIYFEGGKFSDSLYIEIIPSTLKVNQPVKDEVFTIPISQVDRVYDADADMWFEPNKK